MTDRATWCNPMPPGRETRGVEPSVWAALVSAVAALGGVLVGRTTTRSESRIAREDEYLREMQQLAIDVVVSARRLIEVAFEFEVSETCPDRERVDAAYTTLNESLELSEMRIEHRALRELSRDMYNAATDLEVAMGSKPVNPTEGRRDQWVDMVAEDREVIHARIAEFKRKSNKLLATKAQLEQRSRLEQKPERTGDLI